MRDNVMWWLLGGLLATALLGGGVIVYNQTRGLRNNNPGNIRKGSTQWQGMVVPGTDSSFVQFSSPEYGIRALGKTLTTYMNSYGLNTVADIVNRWAPPSENDTTSYINAVASSMGVDPNQPLDASALPGLVAGIIHHENGLNPYPASTIAAGLAMV